MAYIAQPSMLTRRRFLGNAAAGALSLALAACTTTTAVAPGAAIPVPDAAPTIPRQTEPMLHSPEPSLDVKIGQMIMLGFRGATPDGSSAILRAIRELHLGSVVLFDYDVALTSPVRNITSPEQVQTLIAALQAEAEIPLLVAADQEGGRVARFGPRNGFPATFSAQRLGESGDPEATRQQAAAIALTLAAAGVNLNLAPVVDLNINPANPVIGGVERSFSADPAVVAEHAAAFIEAHHSHGILCTAKHFPGHGSSAADTHLGLVDVSTAWSRGELEPYAALIGRGLCDAVMTAHVFHAGLDPELPATLSPAVIDGILRAELGYDGVVITDDMQMKAIRDYYTFPRAVQLAVKAGVDIIAIANNSVYNEDAGAVAVQAIRAMLDTGEIDEARIDLTYQRIRRLKQRLLTGSAIS
jgi:beta-N-acetylhexosaminidase